MRSEPEDEGLEQFPTFGRGLAEKATQAPVLAAEGPVGARQAGSGAADGPTIPRNPESAKHACLLSASRSTSAATIVPVGSFQA
jgi:hypothetical protein